MGDPKWCDSPILKFNFFGGGAMFRFPDAHWPSRLSPPPALGFPVPLLCLGLLLSYGVGHNSHLERATGLRFGP